MNAVSRRPGGLAMAVAAALGAALPAAAQVPPGLPALHLEGAPARASAAALPVVRLADPAKADLDARREISLTFAEPMGIRDVVLMLFRGTPFSVVFDPAVDGTFSGELSNLTLRQALDAILRPVSLEYRLDASVVRVAPRRPETRLFEVSHLDVRREWRRRLSTGPGGDASTADLTAAASSDFFDDLERGVRALLSEAGRAHVDRNAGVIQATDFSDRLDQIGIYVETVTLRAARQVHLQARLLEVTLTGSAIVDRTDIVARAGTAVRQGRGGGLQVSDFEGLLRALDGMGRVRLIAAPQMLAMNNEPVLLRLGAGPRGRGAPDDAEGTGAGRTLEDLSLTITCQVGSDGGVHMAVSPAYSGSAAGAGPADRARVIVEADTVVRVQGGETVMLSGLLSEHRPRTPGTPVPGSGAAGERAELILLLTPTIVNPGPGLTAGAQ